MSYLNKKIIEVSGPLNVIRLEGDVNGTQKVVYLFLDQHMPITSQTECTNVFSKDIQNYLAESFDKLNKSEKIYDFFLEIRPGEIENVNYGLNNPSKVNIRDIYLKQVWKLFRKMFVFESKKNKVSISKYFTNVRLHYMDMRDYIGNIIWYKLLDMLDTATRMWTNIQIEVDDIDEMIMVLNETIEYCQMIKNIIELLKNPKGQPGKNFQVIKYLYKNKKHTENIEEENDQEDFENIYYLVEKTFRLYNHINVKKELGKQLNDIYKDMNYIIKMAKDLINRYDEIAETVLKTTYTLTRDDRAYDKYQYGLSNVAITYFLLEINNSINDFHDVFLDSISKFMDIYFLRRFLDKDYVTNAIVYTGAYHSLFYIKVLTRDFDFKITHVAYSKINNINKLNTSVRKLDIQEMFDIFLPPTFSQCSDISHFPENFE